MLHQQQVPDQLTGVAYWPTVSTVFRSSSRANKNVMLHHVTADLLTHHLQHITDINLRFMLLLSGDVESNPGPKCPCEQEIEGRNTLYIQCSDCKNDWHVSCVGLNEITENPLRKLKSWKCVFCMDIPNKIREKLITKLGPDTGNILQEVAGMEERLNKKIEDMNQILGTQQIAAMEERLNQKIEDMMKTASENSSPSYSVAASKNLLSKVIDTNRMLNNFSRPKQLVITDEEKKTKNDRTLIVKEYLDINIRSSKDIRKAINKKFQGEVIRNARTTVGGSLLVEFDDKETADRIKENWSNTLFGGNKGVVKIKENPPAGIIKNVWQDEETTEDDIIEEIKSTYPDSKIDLFHNKATNLFTGTVKVEFEDDNQLEIAMSDRTNIFGQRYIMEKYNYRPRVIICRYCQEFGHIRRVCRNQLKGKHVCAKCASKEHETKDCVVTQENYKCCHCEGNHEAGSLNCIIMKHKLDELIARSNNG